MVELVADGWRGWRWLWTDEEEPEESDGENAAEDGRNEPFGLCLRLHCVRREKGRRQERRNNETKGMRSGHRQGVVLTLLGWLLELSFAALKATNLRCDTSSPTHSSAESASLHQSLPRCCLICVR